MGGGRRGGAVHFGSGGVHLQHGGSSSRPGGAVLLQPPRPRPTGAPRHSAQPIAARGGEDEAARQTDRRPPRQPIREHCTKTRREEDAPPAVLPRSAVQRSTLHPGSSFHRYHLSRSSSSHGAQTTLSCKKLIQRVSVDEQPQVEPRGSHFQNQFNWEGEKNHSMKELGPGEPRADDWVQSVAVI